MKWFEVDKKGLGKILARRGKEFIIYELLQNAWDEAATEVRVSLTRLPQRNKVMLEVRDDSPEGFADLSHAFTLFAESKKKGDAEKRGRFNLGEKLVLALCDEARISSTRGTVTFNKHGRQQSRARTTAGSVFTGILPMTLREYAACCKAAEAVIPPRDMDTYFNGKLVSAAHLQTSVVASLPTEVCNDEGELRPAVRKTRIEIYEPHPGRGGTLYEMGIPVVETGDRWDVNVTQKVPLTIDRDNVRPAYLGQVRAVVLEHMAGRLTEGDATSPWVRDAVTRHGDKMGEGVLVRVARLRFGEQRVSYDPSDPEANSIATSRGYTVVHGGSMSKPEWEAMRRAEAILPAGKVTPSPRPFHPDGEPLKVIQREDWTPAMHWFAHYADRLGRLLMDVPISVTVADDPGWKFNGAYARSGSLTVNAAAFGREWFEGDLAAINRFLIHEFGHQYASDHLSSQYHDALCRLGAGLAKVALDNPALFKRRPSWRT
jgi:hypothetical protein